MAIFVMHAKGMITFMVKVTARLAILVKAASLAKVVKVVPRMKVAPLVRPAKPILLVEFAA